jgi:metallo-beta-lactamase family protein
MITIGIRWKLLGGKTKVVIAASGMVTGGRVLNYLEEYINKPETTLLFSRLSR